MEIIQKKAKKQKEDEETILIKEIWQRFDPLGFRKITYGMLCSSRIGFALVTML